MPTGSPASAPSAAPLGLQTPRIENAPAALYPADRAAIELAAAYGLQLDPWQRHVMLGAHGELANGLWATPRVGVSVPRQNGKNGILEARHLAGLILYGERLIIHSAHEVKTALEAFLRLKAYFENYDALRKKVRSVSNARGSEEIVLLTGQRIRFMARSKGAGRGFSCDALTLDEAQHLPEAAFAAMLPALSARPNPQVWLTGTPPTPEQDGAVFEKNRDSALQGSSRIYWAEWSGDPDGDFDDPAVWAQANPALGIRLRAETVLDEREAMTDASFARERLGIWSDVSAAYVIHPDHWGRLRTDASAEDLGTVALGVDTAPDRSTTAISLAGFVDGLDDNLQPVMRTLVATTAHRDGVGWAVEYIVARWQRGQVRAVVIDTASAAASLIEPLRARGVLVTTTSTNQYGAACGQLYDAAMDGLLCHTGQPGLNAAVAAARKRRLGDAWAWNRKDTASDITPLVSSTLALWGLHADGIAKPKAAPRQKRVSRAVYSFN